MAQVTVEQAIELAKQHHQAGKLPEAESIYRQVLSAQPNHPEALHLLGVVAAHMGQHETALGLIGRAIGVQPRFPHAFNNLGLTLHAMGRFDEARAAFQQAITIWPDYAIAHFNLSSTLLILGDFENGWRELEWRWKTPQFASLHPKTDKPPWGGADLGGKRILIHAEQGFGDTIQFARYVPLVAQRGGKIVFQCHNELLNLMRGLDGVDQLITHTDALPEFDVHCAMLSLPRVFGTKLENIPRDVPYLRAKSSEPIGDKAAKKVGLAWAGRATPDPNRSIPVEHLAPLAQVTGVTFFNLQAGDVSAPFPLVDCSSRIQDFAGTALLIDSLDLIITIDTAVAHLSGALGKPTWTFLPAIPDWRWMLNRDDSPWYPTMKLFRQPAANDWQTPVRQVAQALHSFVAK